ncbi:dihydrolipoyl dehydrogenase family protein [Salinarimonas ramus]|uniref:Dihydrolipoamide dehydrogenase n=1 Tax=Salinarimonas ramus TaxID=690164 RepID=A0A917Q5B2_9HYPH|nr:FAD-dependent oxidoreductase [Salinarimonas ramus]GGK24035.1 dihydrolipoamide dehydrogenase [Salinarimonas ramus]
MTDLLEPDLCVVGAGAAGLSVAAVAASLGASVVLVEKGAGGGLMGGECLFNGCVPSKSVIAAAAHAHAARTGGPFGVATHEPEVDYAALRDHVRAVIAAIAPNDSVARYRAMGVTVLAEEARFVDARTMEAGAARIRARRFVLATGSRPLVPPIQGLAQTPFLTNETLFDLAERPSRLLVVGAGPIGLELAQAHRRLGAAVTLLSNGPVLPREDREVAGILAAALRAEGVDLRESVEVLGAERAGEGVRLRLRAGEGARQEHIEGSHLLVATGREPTVEGLGLEAAGIAHGPDGIAVDARLRTSNRRVYAIGDCATGGTGGLRFTHAASNHASLVVRDALFRLPAKVDPTTIPRVVYTDPEIAAVGLSEEEAFRKDKRARILRWPVAENDRAQAERSTHGLVKAFVGRDGRVLGCTIAAPHAGELIALWTLAMAKGLKARDIAGIVMPYPTYSELTKRAAVETLRPFATNPWVQRWRRLVRTLG